LASSNSRRLRFLVSVLVLVEQMSHPFSFGCNGKLYMANIVLLLLLLDVANDLVRMNRLLFFVGLLLVLLLFQFVKVGRIMEVGLRIDCR
jgi:hypothetical protein